MLNSLLSIALALITHVGSICRYSNFLIIWDGGNMYVPFDCFGIVACVAWVKRKCQQLIRFLAGLSTCGSFGICYRLCIAWWQTKTFSSCSLFRICRTEYPHEQRVMMRILHSILNHAIYVGISIRLLLKQWDPWTLFINKRTLIYKSTISAFLYKTYVHPYLEYCVPGWSPYLMGDMNLLEKVQHRATKLIGKLISISKYWGFRTIALHFICNDHVHSFTSIVKRW